MNILPKTVQEIADVIGRDQAIYLIGRLPRCVVEHNGGKGASRSRRVIMYVPKVLTPDHVLVDILGWADAQRLVSAFGGEIMCPPILEALYRPWRDDAIRRLVADGVSRELIAEWFGVHKNRTYQLTREIPQEGTRMAANDNAPNSLPADGAPATWINQAT